MKKKIFALLLAAMMLLSLCACGKSADTPSVSGPYAYDSADNSSAEYKSAKSQTAYGGFAAMEEPTAAADSGAPAGGGEAPQDDPQKIIYSADATVETTEFDSACAALLELVDKCGGWVESSSINGSNYYNTARGNSNSRSADYTLRVPSDKFSELMGTLSTLGNVPYCHSYTDNVTAQYYDIDARLTAYKTQETRLLEMMEKAETVSDIITIEDRLTELRYQIESLQSTLNSWDRQVSYSSISVCIQEVREYTPEATQSYGAELWQSLVSGLKDALEFIRDFIVFLVGALPVIIVVGLLVLLAVFVIRRIVKAGKARKEKKAAKKLAETQREGSVAKDDKK